MSEIVRILQQRLERSEAENLVQDVGDQRFALEQAERRRLALALEQPEDQALDFRLGVLALAPSRAVPDSGVRAARCGRVP